MGFLHEYLLLSVNSVTDLVGPPSVPGLSAAGYSVMSAAGYMVQLCQCVALIPRLARV